MKKIEITNNFFKVLMYIFLIYNLLINLVSFSLDIYSVLSTSLVVVTLVLLLLKHKKVKLFTQIYTVIKIIGSSLLVSIIMKVGVNININYNVSDLIIMFIDFCFCIYLFIGSKKYYRLHQSSN